MQVLQSMNGVDSQVFANACVSFKDVNNRRVFASILDNNRRLDWIYNHLNVQPQTAVSPPSSYRLYGPYGSSYTPTHVTPEASNSSFGSQ